MFSHRNTKALIWAIISALTVFILGFGAMFLIYNYWRENNPSSELPGLFYYKASAIGDPICLPIIIGALIYDHCIQKEENYLFKRSCIICAALAFIIGALIQAEWLINNDTGLNWSIPQPHHFNFGGWYHAVFFVTTITVITLLLVDYVWESIRKPSVVSDSFLCFGLIFFSLLHFMDDYINKFSPITSLLTASLVLIGFCGVIKTIQSYRLKVYSLKQYLPILLSGILSFILSCFLL